VRISGSNAGYTTFRGSVKSTGYPLHSPVSPFTSPPVRHRVPSHSNWTPPVRAPHRTYPINTAHVGRPGYRSLYINSLRAVRSGDRMSVGARFSVPKPTDVYRVFLGSKRPEPRADHPPLSSRGLQMCWHYTSASHLCLSRHVMG
jgi:hypothetical protein